MAEAVRDEREPAQHDKDAEARTGDGNDKSAHKRPHDRILVLMGK